MFEHIGSFTGHIAHFHNLLDVQAVNAAQNVVVYVQIILLAIKPDPTLVVNNSVDVVLFFRFFRLIG